MLDQESVTLEILERTPTQLSLWTAYLIEKSTQTNLNGEVLNWNRVCIVDSSSVSISYPTASARPGPGATEPQKPRLRST